MGFAINDQLGQILSTINYNKVLIFAFRRNLSQALHRNWNVPSIMFLTDSERMMKLISLFVPCSPENQGQQFKPWSHHDLKDSVAIFDVPEFCYFLFSVS